MELHITALVFTIRYLVFCTLERLFISVIQDKPVLAEIVTKPGILLMLALPLLVSTVIKLDMLLQTALNLQCVTKRLITKLTHVSFLGLAKPHLFLPILHQHQHLPTSTPVTTTATAPENTSETATETSNTLMNRDSPQPVEAD